MLALESSQMLIGELFPRSGSLPALKMRLKDVGASEQCLYLPCFVCVCVGGGVYFFFFFCVLTKLLGHTFFFFYIFSVT